MEACRLTFAKFNVRMGTPAQITAFFICALVRLFLKKFLYNELDTEGKFIPARFNIVPKVSFVQQWFCR